MKKLSLIIVSAIIIALVAPILATPAFAGDPAPTTTPSSNEGIQHLKDLQFDVSEYLNLGGEDQEQSYFGEGKNPIVEFILRIINFALTIMGSIGIIILIIGGFMMMVSQGNQQKLDEAKDIVKYAIIGIIIAFLAYVIVLFVQSIFIDN